MLKPCEIIVNPNPPDHPSEDEIERLARLLLDEEMRSSTSEIQADRSCESNHQELHHS